MIDTEEAAILWTLLTKCQPENQNPKQYLVGIDKLNLTVIIFMYFKATAVHLQIILIVLWDKK